MTRVRWLTMLLLAAGAAEAVEPQRSVWIQPVGLLAANDVAGPVASLGAHFPVATRIDLSVDVAVRFFGFVDDSLLNQGVIFFGRLGPQFRFAEFSGPGSESALFLEPSLHWVLASEQESSGGVSRQFLRRAGGIGIHGGLRTDLWHRLHLAVLLGVSVLLQDGGGLLSELSPIPSETFIVMPNLHLLRVGLNF